MARQELEAAIADLELTIESVFVPWSKSRSAKPDTHAKDRSLNWHVTLKRGGRDVLTSDYTAGIAHCPSYKNHVPGTLRWTIDATEAIEYETEQGKSATRMGSVLKWGGYGGAPILPDSVDVLWSLVQDAGVLDYSRFEDWASDLGYDPDSRRGESIYRECLSLALALRNGIGDEGLKRLQEASQDY